MHALVQVLYVADHPFQIIIELGFENDNPAFLVVSVPPSSQGYFHSVACFCNKLDHLSISVWIFLDVVSKAINFQNAERRISVFLIEYSFAGVLVLASEYCIVADSKVLLGMEKHVVDELFEFDNPGAYQFLFRYIEMANACWIDQQHLVLLLFYEERVHLIERDWVLTQLHRERLNIRG